MKENRSILHVYLKSEDKNLYFGSMAAMYDYFCVGEIGIAYSSLRNYLSVNKTDMYENSICIIRKGELRIKSTPGKTVLVRKSKTA